MLPTLIMSDEVKLHARASRGTVLALSILLTIPISICALAAIRHPSMWLAVLIGGGGFGTFLLWLSAYRIDIENGSFTYSNLFHGKVVFPIETIKDAQVKVGYSKYADRFRPPVRLEIMVRDGQSEKMVVVNLKVFCQKDIEACLKLLHVKTS
jgi:hypothetical protein